MLVLTRKVDESILVGDDVEIIVVEIRGDQVRLGISAPRSIPIYRKELYQEVAGETKLAARNVPADVYAAMSVSTFGRQTAHGHHHAISCVA